MSADRIAARADEILAMVRNLPRVKALSEPERLAWARSQAERELASVPWLPGGFSWAKIEATYRDLAKNATRPRTLASAPTGSPIAAGDGRCAGHVRCNSQAGVCGGRPRPTMAPTRTLTT